MVTTTPLRAQTPDVSVFYHERLGGLTVTEGRARPQALGAAPSVGPSLSFAAFGRQFDVDLRSNRRLTSTLDPEVLARVERIDLYEGELRGVAGSWARLTRYRGEWSGVISDGVELYAIDSLAHVAPYLVGTVDAASDAPVIFRWRDTVGPLIDTVRPTTALPGGTGVRRAPLALSPLAAISPGKQIDVGLVGDFGFAAIQGAGAQAAMLSMANVADGIFVSQVGVHLNVAQLEVLSSGSDPLSSLDPPTLLSQLGTLKATTPTLANLGVAHLFTSREFSNPAILGIAKLGSLCEVDRSVGLTRVTAVSIGGLIAAHELGHNFGAPHDGEAGSPCASTVGSYIMNPTFSGADTFSTCSLQQMQPVIAAASCLYAPLPNDVSLRGISGPTSVLFGDRYYVDFAIESHGAGDALGVSLSFVADGATVDSVMLQDTVNRSQCKYAPPAPPECHIQYLHDGESITTRAFGVTNRVGQASLQVAVASINDSNPLNNTYTVGFDVAPTAELAISRFEANPNVVDPHGVTDVTLDFSNGGPATATQVTASLFVYSAFTVQSITVPSGTCGENPSSPGTWSCPVGTLAPNESQHITARLQEAGGIPVWQAPVYASVAATEPSLHGGAHATTNVQVVSAIADLSVTLSASPASLPVGGGTKITVHLINTGVDTVDDAALHVDPDGSGGFTIDSVDAGDVSCSPPYVGHNCTVGPIPGGGAVDVRFSGTAHFVGKSIVNARVESGAYDPNMNNNSTQMPLDVTAPPPSSPPSSGGGGGGSIDWLSVALLAALARLRRAQSHAAASTPTRESH